MSKILKKKLTNANKQIDRILPSLWEQGENNLKRLAAEYEQKHTSPHGPTPGENKSNK